MSNFIRSFYEMCNKIMVKNCSIGEDSYDKKLFENSRVQIVLFSHIMKTENCSPKLFINTLCVEDVRNGNSPIEIFYGHHTIGGGGQQPRPEGRSLK